MLESAHNRVPQPHALRKAKSSRITGCHGEPPGSNRHTYGVRPIPIPPVASEIAHLASLAEKVNQLQALLVRQTPRLAIKTQRRILFVSPADVMAVEAKRNYVLLQLPTTSYLLRDAISSMADKLERYGFIRIHRSVLINASWVQEIEPQPSGEYLVRTQDGREYAATRTYIRNLKSLAQFWIGSSAFRAQDS